jgi:hypothetical protein
MTCRRISTSVTFGPRHSAGSVGVFLLPLGRGHCRSRVEHTVVIVGNDVFKSARLELQSTAIMAAAAADTPKTLSFRGKTDHVPSSQTYSRTTPQLSNSLTSSVVSMAFATMITSDIGARF